MTGADPWSLPAAQSFLAELEPLIWQGGAVIGCDASTPPGFAARLVAHLRETVRVEPLVPRAGELPLALLGEASGQPGATLDRIARSGRVFLIEAQGLPAPDLARWAHALAEFARQVRDAPDGGALLFLGEAVVPGFKRLDWARRLRRVDAMIWAEYAVPAGRNELMQRLAVDLAVELCGWRLDLVADLVSQRVEDIVDPTGWLQRNVDQAVATPIVFGLNAFSCPLHLMVQGDHVELRRRIWKAQLSVLFPWIEGHRQRLIERYRSQLQLDDHLRGMGVSSVDDIEMGGLRRQLGRVLAREQAEQVAALANLRNDLAHRKPISAADFQVAGQIRSGD